MNSLNWDMMSSQVEVSTFALLTIIPRTVFILLMQASGKEMVITLRDDNYIINVNSYNAAVNHFTKVTLKV